jgi:hypothetical protein
VAKDENGKRRQPSEHSLRTTTESSLSDRKLNHFNTRIKNEKSCAFYCFSLQHLSRPPPRTAFRSVIEAMAAILIVMTLLLVGYGICEWLSQINHLKRALSLFRSKT